ncbi:DUF148 domain-containing protein [Aphelenchoides fujianensis]|nr:DUF148 domain-containing protein [Aphelenchoides fujianensis]
MRTLLVLLAVCAVASARFHGLFKNLNEKQKEELKAILHNQDATRAQIHSQVEEWVKKQDESVQKAFAEAEKKKEEWKKKHAEKHAKRVENVSPAAKQVDEQIVAIWKNQDLTRKQTCEQINAVLAKTTGRDQEGAEAGDPRLLQAVRPPPREAPRRSPPEGLQRDSRLLVLHFLPCSVANIYSIRGI